MGPRSSRSRACERALETREHALATEHIEDFVDARADGAAGDGDAHRLRLGTLAQPVRVAVTGGTVSPGIYEVLDVLGRERTLARLEAVSTRLATARGAVPP